MTCHEFWNTMPELTGDLTQLDHLGECPSCAACFERYRELAAGLKDLAGSLDIREASPSVELRLIQAFRARGSAKAASPRPHWLGWAVAAALIIAAVFLTAEWRPQHLPLPNWASVEGAADQSAGDGVDAEFIPLPYGSTDPSGTVPVQGADLVRVEVSQSALIALGVPVPDGGPGRVEAVVALGPEGTLQGIQIIQ